MKYIQRIKNKFVYKKENGFYKNSEDQKIFLYLSAFPKSGSSFISLVLQDLLKFDLVDLIYSHFGEQDLYEPKLKKFTTKDTLTKHHTLASKPNVNLFEKYDIKPIILTRNLPDVIASLRDHISKTLIWPHFYVPNKFNEMSIEVQYDFLIKYATPWYIHFYTSWKNVEKENILDVKFIQYENFHKNKINIIEEILEFWNFKFTIEEINASVKHVENLSIKKNRVNKGIMNRGQELLTKPQLERIESFTKYYQDIDFSIIK